MICDILLFIDLVERFNLCVNGVLIIIYFFLGVFYIIVYLTL